MDSQFRLRAKNYDGKRVHISWGKTSDVIIERSRRQAGSWNQVDQVGLSSQYIDILSVPRNSRDEFYYRIRPGNFTLRDEDGNPIKDDDGNNITTEPDDKTDRDIIGPVRVEPDVSTGTAYVRRQAERHLRRVGEEAYLIEESEGKRCPDCWDPIRKVRERSNCDTCGGSGFVDGWSEPIDVYMSFGAGEAEPKQTQGGKLSALQLQCWASAIPEMDIGDHVVRDRDREVFRVVKRKPTKKEGHDIRQNVILKMVERGAKERSVAQKISP